MTANSTRITAEDTFFEIAWTLSKLATCPRRSVGCVIVDSYGAIISSGFNASPGGMPSCFDAGCLDEGGHCVRTVHAEVSAIAYAANRGVRLVGCTAFCTLLPCIQCMQALWLAGVPRILYDESYMRSEKDELFKLNERQGAMLVERQR